MTPFSEREWVRAREQIDSNDDSVEQAIAFFIYCRQSLAGRMGCFASISRNRTRRGMNEQVSAWLNAIDGLPEVHARLQRVVILNRPALEVIKKEDGPNTLFYLDPPYLHQTRISTAVYGSNGQYEMTEEDHRKMLELLSQVKGKIMLSGYPSELYDQALEAWRRHDFILPNNASGGTKKRRMIECLWCNFSTVS